MSPEPAFTAWLDQAKAQTKESVDRFANIYRDAYDHFGDHDIAIMKCVNLMADEMWKSFVVSSENQQFNGINNLMATIFLLISEQEQNK